MARNALFRKNTKIAKDWVQNLYCLRLHSQIMHPQFGPLILDLHVLFLMKYRTRLYRFIISE